MTEEDMNKLLEDAKAVIFDVDGLLIDSEPIWQAARDEFEKRHNTVMPKELHTKVVGMGMREVVTLFKEGMRLTESVEDLMVEYRSIFYELALQEKKLQLMPGAQSLVEQLHGASKIMAVATGGHLQGKMKGILEVFHLEQYFSVIVSTDQVKRGKPAPDIFLFTAQELGVPKEECVILEDAVNGVQAAKAADMKVIGVQQDKKVAEKLSELGADVVVGSLEELV